MRQVTFSHEYVDLLLKCLDISGLACKGLLSFSDILSEAVRNRLIYPICEIL